MKIGYMPDTHGGPYNQPEPTPEASAKFCDQLLNEGIVAHAGAVRTHGRQQAASLHADKRFDACMVENGGRNVQR